MTPNPLVVQAIREKRRLSFDYNGTTRIAEPQCYGIGTKGTELLRAHLTGARMPAALFDLAKATDLVLLAETFDRPGHGYVRDDSAMATIFAQL